MTIRFTNKELRVPVSNMKVLIIGMATIITTLVTGVWQARAYYDGWITEKKETNQRLSVIEKQLKIKPAIDSIQDAKIALLSSRVDTIMFNKIGQQTAINIGQRLYIQRKVNGKITWIPANNSTVN